MKKILITGTAGFIGYHLVNYLSEDEDNQILGLDSINSYYDVDLKYDRLKNAGIEKGEIAYNKEIASKKKVHYTFIQLDLKDKKGLFELFEKHQFEYVCHLAAQAGVRHSLSHPDDYVDNNIISYVNLLEAVRYFGINHFVYASSSSVYGLNTKIPFSENSATEHPASLYAASKKSNELMAHAYSHLFKIPTTGLRFFSVYGPWGRPDMALFLFTKSILENTTIKVFNNGEMRRDFTYIDDIVKGISKVIFKPAKRNPEWNSDLPETSSSQAAFKIYNIGNQNTINLVDFITEIENNLSKKAIKEYLPMQAGDIAVSLANSNALAADFDYRPTTSVKEGISKFIRWYKEYYGY